jgi:hypothetical protein
MPCVLGHALFMKAMHGGKATNDRIDAPKSAVLLRGGMLPQAYADPAARRATRDLLRRRLHLRRQRVEKPHGKGKALTMLAHHLARAVYDMLTRERAFDRHQFLIG